MRASAGRVPALTPDGNAPLYLPSTVSTATASCGLAIALLLPAIICRSCSGAQGELCCSHPSKDPRHASLCKTVAATPASSACSPFSRRLSSYLHNYKQGAAASSTGSTARTAARKRIRRTPSIRMHWDVHACSAARCRTTALLPRLARPAPCAARGAPSSCRRPAAYCCLHSWGCAAASVGAAAPPFLPAARLGFAAAASPSSSLSSSSSCSQGQAEGLPFGCHLKGLAS